MATKLLHDTKLRSLKPGTKRLSDGSGLYLLPFFKGGSHGWRFDYTLHRVRKTLSLGIYPEVTLTKARELAEEMRTKVALGIDPSEERKAKRSKEKAETHMRSLIRKGEALTVLGSFGAAALQWHHYWSKARSSTHVEKTRERLINHLFPSIGSKPVENVAAQDIREILEKVEASGFVDTAHRLRWICIKVYKYAASKGMVTQGYNPAQDIELNPAISKKMSAIVDPTGLASVLRAIDSYAGTAVVRSALALLPLVAQRPGNLRSAEWDQIDLIEGWWRIPAPDLKLSQQNKANSDEHWVPLPRQAIEILKALRPITGRGKFVFPNQSSPNRPMSENTINAALEAMGFSGDVVTGHGFRATFRTVMDEVLYVDPFVLEAQLAHRVAGPLGDIYSRVEYREFRFAVMQLWADYLDALRKGSSQAMAFEQSHRKRYGQGRLEMDVWRHALEPSTAVTPAPAHTPIELTGSGGFTWDLRYACTRVALTNFSYTRAGIHPLPAPVEIGPV